MPRAQIRGARSARVLLLVMALPLSAQSPNTPEQTAQVASAQIAAPAANDPSMLNAEPQPRASKSLLLAAVRNAAGYFVVGERGHILFSSDGSQWRQASVPTRSTLTAVDAAGGHLWAAGHDGVILHSADNARTWSRQRVSPWRADSRDSAEGMPVLDLLFTDAQHGFAIGAYSLMLVTDNGGQTWTPRNLHDSGTSVAPAAVSPAAASDGDEWTFSAEELSLDAELDPHFNTIARVGSGALVIAGERGTFLRSRDGGRSWENRRLPYEGSMFGVLAWEGEHILVFGLRGNVYESTDLGNSWVRVETGITHSLMGGYALPNGGAILVGANGAVLTRADSSSPFTSSTFQNAANETPLLSGVLPAAQGQYLLIGDKGVDLYRPQ